MEEPKVKSSDHTGKLVVISGASAGAGKDTILKLFLDRHPDWANPPSAVTRQPRAGEVDGKDYYFIDAKTFQDRQARGEFLETDHHAGHWYGTLKQPILNALAAGKNVIVRKDVNGATEIKRQLPKTVVIFIDVEELGVLEARLRNRQTETEAEIQHRLALAKKEQEFKKHFDYVVVNIEGQADTAVKDIEKALGL